MRVKIKEASETESVSFGRIEEIEEGQDLETCFLCNGKPRPELTEDGTDVQYCGEVCKELHFPPDKETAWPIVVKYRSQVGRYILASRDIAAGEIIFTEEALALGPAHDSLPSCLNCLKLSPPDGYLCPKCGLPVCDEMCAEGEEHSKECVILQKLDRQEHVEDYTSPAPIYWCIATLRLLRLRKHHLTLTYHKNLYFICKVTGISFCRSSYRKLIFAVPTTQPMNVTVCHCLPNHWVPYGYGTKKLALASTQPQSSFLVPYGRHTLMTV